MATLILGNTPSIIQSEIRDIISSKLELKHDIIQLVYGTVNNFIDEPNHLTLYFSNKLYKLPNGMKKVINDII